MTVCNRVKICILVIVCVNVQPQARLFDVTELNHVRVDLTDPLTVCNSLLVDISHEILTIHCYAIEKNITRYCFEASLLTMTFAHDFLF